MKRLTRALALLGALLGAAGTRAGTLFSDPYGVGAPDVLGSGANFDIRSLEVQELGPSLLRINLDLNYYGGGTPPSPFPHLAGSVAARPRGVSGRVVQGRLPLWWVPP